MRLDRVSIGCGVFLGLLGFGSPFASAQGWNAPATYELESVPLANFINATVGLTVNDRDINLGGIGSDLWHGPGDGPGIYWMITDRGPNGENPRTFPVPEFTPTILKVRTENGKVKILQAIPIIGSGNAVTGVTGIPNMVNLSEPPATNEEFFACDGTTKLGTTASNPFGTNPNGLDTEGLVRTRDGYFWIAEEYGPSLLKVDPQGRVVKRFLPTDLETYIDPTGYASDDSTQSIPKIFGLKRKLNRGFEGLTLSPNEKILYIALQSPLNNPTTGAGNNARNTRILAFDIAAEKVVAEYVYRFHLASEFPAPAGQPANRTRDMKISALSMVDDRRMLVLERTDFIAKVYLVDLKSATNILGTSWDDVLTSPSLEEAVSDAALQQTGITVLPQTLIATFDSTQGFPQKIEGLTVLNGETLAIANDNDFGIGSFTDLQGACRLVDTNRKSEIRVILLPASIK